MCGTFDFSFSISVADIRSNRRLRHHLLAGDVREYQFKPVSVNAAQSTEEVPLSRAVPRYG